MTTSTIRSFATLIVLAGLTAGPVTAQTISTWTSSSSGNWSVDTNWDIHPSALGGPGTVIQLLGGSGSITATQNLQPSYTLSQIYLAGAAADFSSNPNPKPPAPGATANYTIAGNLTFVSGTIYNPDPAAFEGDSGSSIDGIPTITGANISAASTNSRLLFTGTLTFNTATSIALQANNANGAAVFITGPLVGAGNLSALSFSPGAISVIASSNNVNYTGSFSQGTGGITYLAAINTFLRNSVSVALTASITAGSTTTAGYGSTDAGFNQQHGSIGGNGSYSVGTNDSAATVLAGFNNNSTTLGRNGGLSVYNPASHFGKVGIGTLTVSGINSSLNGQISVRDGVLLLNTASGGITNSSGFAAGALSIYAGGMLRMNNGTAFAPGAPAGANVQGRISDTAPLRLAGGKLRIDGHASAAFTEDAGLIRPLAGLSVIELNTTSGSGAAIGLNFSGINTADLSRGGMIAFVGFNLGGTGTATAVTFNATPGVVSGVAARPATVPTAINGILPYALSQTTYINNGTANATNTINPDTFAEVVGSSIRPLTTFADNTFNSSTANVRVTSAQAPTGSSVASSLLIDTAGSLTLASPLTLTSGAIFGRGGAITGGGGITTSGRLYLSSSADFLIGTPLTGTGISKGGNANIALTPALTLGTSPLIAVNSGTLTLSAAIPNAPIYQVSKGAMLSGLNTLALGSTIRGNGTVSGNIVMPAGSLLGASSLAGESSTGAAPGALNFTGSLSFTGGSDGGNASRLRFYLSSVFGSLNGTSGQYTQSIVSATSLDLTGVTAPIAVQPHGLTLDDAGTGKVYDFDNTKSYSWTFITTTTGIVGFATNKFTVDTDNFAPANDLAGGSFAVAVSGNDLMLNFTPNPVPEPVLLGLAAVGLLALTRRKQ